MEVEKGIQSLEERIDERRQSGAFRQNDDKAKQEQNHDDRPEPPLLALSHESPKFPQYRKTPKKCFKKTHLSAVG